MSSTVFNPSADQASFISLADQASAPAGGIASRTLLQTPGGKLLVFSLEAGQEMSEHTNSNHAILSGLTGSPSLPEKRPTNSTRAICCICHRACLMPCILPPRLLSFCSC